MTTKVNNFKEASLVYEETKKGKTADGNTYKKHYFKYKHSSGDGSSTKNARFKCGFSVNYPQGLYFDKGKKGDDDGDGGGKKFPKLTGKAVFDFSDPDVMKFGDAPSRGAKNGWVREKDVESTGYEEFEAKEDIPYFEDADDEKDPVGTIPAGTKLSSSAKEEEFYQITFGGGGEGMFYKLQKQTAKLLWKNRKTAQIDKQRYKSEKDVLKDLKCPFKWKTDDKGKVLDKQDWYMKISYRAKGRDNDGNKVDGFMAKFEVPGIGDMSLDEMMDHSITGKACFTFVCVYEGSDKLAMQIYTGSCVVSDLAEVERSSAQQEEVDELAGNAEFVARMKAKLGPRKKSSSSGKGKKSRFDKEDSKSKKKSKKKSDESDEDESGSDEEKNVKSFLAPSMEKVEESGGSDSDDEVIKGVPPPKREEDSDDEEEAPPPPPKGGKKGKDKKKAPPKEDSDEEEAPPPPPKGGKKGKGKKAPPPKEDSDDEEEAESPPPPPKGGKKGKGKKAPPPKEDSDDDEEEEAEEEEAEEEEAPPPKGGKKGKGKKKKTPPPSPEESEEEDED